MNLSARCWSVAACLGALYVGACGDDSTDSTAGSGGKTATGGAGTSSSGGTGGSKSSAGSSGGGSSTIASQCGTEATDIDKAVCAANAFLGVLSSSERQAVQLELSDAKSRTLWSNLPGKTRAGMKMGSLSSDSQAAALALMQVVLSEAGMTDLTGVRAADDYLGSMSGSSGPGAGAYAAANYSISIFGSPSATGDWALAFGGHHMAYNLTFKGGDSYPVPNHLGCEPKASFSINGSSYEPLSDESKALLDLYKSLSSSELASAYLSGQTFADVLIGPIEYDTGSLDAVKAKYPTGDSRTGIKVSALSETQQGLVKAAIEAWVGDYQSSVAQSLRDAYTSSTAFQDTLVAWGGTQSAGVDPDVNGTYMRIDGPRVWIEVACQNGVVIQGKTHYHTIFRDKQYDYGGSL